MINQIKITICVVNTNVCQKRATKTRVIGIFCELYHPIAKLKLRLRLTRVKSGHILTGRDRNAPQPSTLATPATMFAYRHLRAQFTLARSEHWTIRKKNFFQPPTRRSDALYIAQTFYRFRGASTYEVEYRF